MKLHLGCGKRYLPGYVHIDVVEFSHIEHICDVRDLSFLEPNSVSEIYFCHGIEYFDRIEILSVLSNWGTVLETGGILRLAVPDFSSIVKLYQEKDEIDGPGILGPLFGRWTDGAGKFMYHRTAYDEKSLRKTLLVSGFVGLQKWSPFEDFPAEYDDHSKAFVPHMDFENGTPVSLNLMGRKA